jgi:hypothetical protein
MKSKAGIRNTRELIPRLSPSLDILACFRATAINFPQLSKTLLIFTPQQRNETIQIVNDPVALAG